MGFTAEAISEAAQAAVAGTSYPILRQCGLPRVNFLTRTYRPDLIRPALQRFDDMVFRVLAERLHLPPSLPLVARQQLSWPKKYTGWAFRNQSFVSPVAYWVSLTQLVADLRELPADALHNSPTWQAMLTTHDTLLRRYNLRPRDKHFPQDPNGFIDFYKTKVDDTPIKHLQRKLTRKLEELSYTERSSSSIH